MSYFWKSDQTTEALERRLEEEGGPVPDYFGFPFYFPVSVAKTDNGELFLYGSTTETSDAPNTDTEYVREVDNYTVLLTHEGLTEDGKKYAEENGLTGRSFEETGRAIMAQAGYNSNVGRAQAFKPQQPPSAPKFSL